MISLERAKIFHSGYSAILAGRSKPTKIKFLTSSIDFDFICLPLNHWFLKKTSPIN